MASPGFAEYGGGERPMTFWETFVLGLVQGLTEFLPVSSSAHLVMGHTLFDLGSDVVFDALVHGATMLATVAYFRGRLVDLLRGRSPGYLGKLLLATVPAGAVGLGFRESIERAFGSPALVVATLFVTGVALMSLYFVPPGKWEASPHAIGGRVERGHPEPTWWAAWWIGCAQAVSILPGISRSGSTIVTGIWLGVVPAAAAEFSFLLGIPTIAGAVILQAGGLDEAASRGLGAEYVIGAAAAFVSGIVSIYLVFRFLARREFRWFGFYCWAAAILFGAYLALR